MRVFISPGNHDPYVPASLYRAIEPVPDNVTIFRERRFRPISLTDGLTLWGFGHERERDLDPALGDFHCSGPGAHLFLFHGSDRNRIPPHKECIAPFSAEEIGRSGALHAMVGHFHAMLQGPNYAYSGSPEPLNFAQDGRHTASLVSVEDGRLGLDFIDINATRYVEAEVDMAGIGDRAHAAEAIQAKVAGQISSPREVFCRVRLVGAAPPTLDLDADDLEKELESSFPGIEITADYATFDLDEIEREGHTVRAAFVKALRERRAQSQEADGVLVDKALQYGLLAFARRELRP
jgi:DNA repair exonuclease SbcCD nuclease subunit